MKKEVLRTYIFHRGNVFYFVELRDDKDAVANAIKNIGTTKVTTVTGKLIWKLKLEQ